jgi:nucleotide-binding universal stress UspA family protein
MHSFRREAKPYLTFFNENVDEKERGKEMIPQIKKIFYASAISQNSAYAFYYAVDLAQKHGAEIIILHTLEPISPSVMPYMEREMIDKIQKSNIEETIEEIKNRLQNFCKRAEAQIGPSCADLVSKILVPLGHPPEKMLNATEEEGCDVIVLGTHGKGFLAHTFLGSVSSAV